MIRGHLVSAWVIKPPSTLTCTFIVRVLLLISSCVQGCGIPPRWRDQCASLPVTVSTETEEVSWERLVGGSSRQEINEE